MPALRTIRAALTWGRTKLDPLSETAASDARVVLTSLLEQDPAWLLAHPDTPLSDEIQDRYQLALERIIAGESLPYVIGHWAFFGRLFRVSPSVLIPRPETEGLIEISLEFLGHRGLPCRVADVGTGSGCIAVTLAAEQPAIQILATDRSMEALMVAKENAASHRVSKQIVWMQGDLLSPVSARFDLVVANLPYIPTSRLNQLSVAAQEPLEALDGGEHGMDLIKRLILQLPDRLRSHGMALLEVDESHGAGVARFANEVLPAADVNLTTDLAGLDRYISIDLRTEA